MQQIVLASGNKGKLKEFQQLFAPFGLEVLPQSAFNVPEAEETGLSFVENAIIKARNAAEHTGLPAIADDSGIEVDALDGQPGIYSARFAGDQCNDADNNKKLLELLADTPESQRGARFQCLLVFMRNASDPTPLICQGTWEGSIAYKQSGSNGFGYDSLFLVPEKHCCSAELNPDEKNALSHRGKAINQLITAMECYLSAD